MKLSKRIDLYIQVLLIVTGTLYAFFAEGPDFLLPYIVVGSWQVLSCILHVFFEKFYPARDRKYYANTLLIIVVIGVFSLVGFILAFLIGLLIVSPFLAIWYVTICYREILLLENKELEELKLKS